SKLLAAPQLKVSWIRLSGPPELTAPLAEALDTIADTFLSVNSPVACALPELLTLADSSIARIRQRCATNLAALQGLGDDYRVRRTEGGWTALVDVPRVMDDDELGHRLLERGLAAHPGWFYDVGDTGSIAVSLLPTPGTFADSLMRLAAALGAHH
ncbi:MAG: pyridoxal phosphate-dependent aminotransferase, partial [Propionibacteriaceae bacterium]|nr:pyridoxal phosphate-dependent aminotransferase [Propionibacteriaceae bacterium]